MHEMNLAWAALVLVAGGFAALGAGCGNGRGEPPPHCELPDGGPRCSCPGVSVFTSSCTETFTCRQDGTWAPYDASCLASSSQAGAIPGDSGGTAPSDAMTSDSSECNYDDPSLRYVGKGSCATIDWGCSVGVAFQNACGCGCTVPAGVDAGAADVSVTTTTADGGASE